MANSLLESGIQDRLLDNRWVAVSHQYCQFKDLPNGCREMFSQTAEYALRAIVWLAEHAKDQPIGNQRIAEGTSVPVSYLAKIMQGLTQAELVNSRRGAGGGFVLNYEPEDITVLDVLNAVDPIKRITSCPLNLKSHGKKRCGMHSRLDAAMEMVEVALSNSTIAEILNDRSRPKPMSDSQVR